MATTLMPKRSATQRICNGDNPITEAEWNGAHSCWAMRSREGPGRERPWWGGPYGGAKPPPDWGVCDYGWLWVPRGGPMGGPGGAFWGGCPGPPFLARPGRGAKIVPKLSRLGELLNTQKNVHFFVPRGPPGGPPGGAHFGGIFYTPQIPPLIVKSFIRGSRKGSKKGPFWGPFLGHFWAPRGPPGPGGAPGPGGPEFPGGEILVSAPRAGGPPGGPPPEGPPEGGPTGRSGGLG